MMMNKQNLAAVMALLLTLFLTLTFPADSYAQETDSHTVQQGETLFSIAKQYDITVSDLRKWNNLESTTSLSIGQVLQVAPPASEEAVIHTVEPGETLFAISRKYNVTIAEIQQWNNLPGSELTVGSELTIYPDESDSAGSPVQETEEPSGEVISRSLAEEASESTGYYLVKSGDSLSKIAREHNMTIEELKRLNNLQSDIIRVGQQLTVRQAQSAPSVAEAGDDLESSPQGKFVIYSVSGGETLTDILDKFEMTQAELSALNPGAEISELNRGQRLTVLMPPVKYFANPYKKRDERQNLGSIQALVYQENSLATPTTSGELYNPEQLTAAHPNMALGAVVFVENQQNKRGVYVKINDRFSGDGIKLSKKAYQLLNFNGSGPSIVSIYQD